MFQFHHSTPLNPLVPYKVMSEAPHIGYISGFLSPEECRHLQKLAEDNLAPSFIVDPDTGEHRPVESRTSSLTFLPLGVDPVVASIEARIAQWVQKPVVNGEGFQLLRYQAGQEYQAHYDYFDPAIPGSVKALEKGGQRYATVLLYLNTVPAGGETDFPLINSRVKPVQGDALLFYNCTPDGVVDGLTMHASLPVQAGEKWVATKWVRERPYC